MNTFLQNLRFAFRTLLKKPGFTGVAVLTLALGIGASTAVFSVVYGVLLKPLPFPEPERLVSVHHRGYNQGPGTYFTYRDHQRVFEDVGAWESDQVSITGRGEPERVAALTMTDGTLPLLRVQPALGRLFTRDDDAPGSPLRVVLTHGYWQRRFGGAPDAVGQTLAVDGVHAQVIGVLPASFRFLDTQPSVLLPMRLDPADGAAFDFQALARLRPGVTLESANADVARMIPLLPEHYQPFRLQPNVRPLAEDVVGSVGQILWILLAAVGLVLLIAGANVSNLFLVRAEGRQQEFAMRAALGATRGHIARQLLAESVLLAVAAGALGLALAQAALGLLRRMAPANLPRVDEIAIDPAVLLFTLAVSLLSGLLFGLLPGLRLGRVSASALREGGRSASDAPGRHRTRNLLVVAQLALAVVLLVVAGLMIRTFVALRHVEPGFVRAEQVQTFRLAVPDEALGDVRRVARTFEQIAQRLEQVPGVASVGLASSITMDGEDNANPLYVEHVEVAEGELPPLRRFKSVAPGYFETMGNPLVAGREITWADVYRSVPAVVVSEKLAREYWGGPSAAIGKRVRGSREGSWQEIVGVVGDERDDGLDKPAAAIVYWPMLHPTYLRSSMVFAVRSSRVGSPGFLRELQQAVWSVDPDLPLAGAQTLEEIRARSMARTSFAMVMLGIAAGVALLLGVVGIYGVTAFVAAQRTRELGIRVALGAQAADVRRLVLAQGTVLTGAGVALGLLGSLGVTRVMASLLFGVSTTDPLTLAGVSVFLASIALLASYLPARRATRVDPIIALRGE